eukprot:TRINITY_DN27745_c0_g1_i1.p1 TRINITY_DN27745_c0_g1~~TRINITY_DN27745_c0_g1_i1.p1  ORF type:complete len:938 (-),score=20.82 TRINITY_DN27745_c0_g1_i1:55-2625(-)
MRRLPKGKVKKKSSSKKRSTSKKRSKSSSRSQSPVRGQPKPKKTLRALNEAHLDAQMLEVTQGGATLWTVAGDGSLNILSGANLQVVQSFIHSDLAITCLYSSDKHVWVGMHDGTVCIYDQLLCILLSEARYHFAPVTSFAAGHDKRVWSGSEDTTLVQWDTEENNFVVLRKGVGVCDKPVRCLACSDLYVYVGGDSNLIHCLDVETAEVLDVLHGHDAAITCMKIEGPFLFTGSKDCTVSVWELQTHQQIHVLSTGAGHIDCHNASISAVLTDPVSHRLWTADVNGHIRVWDLRPSKRFRLLHKIRDISGNGIVQLKSMFVIDAIRLWTFGADGMNHMWYSMSSRTNDSKRGVVETMKLVLYNDQMHLAKWKQLITSLDGINTDVRAVMCDTLLRTNKLVLLQRTYEKWIRWVTQHKTRKNKKWLIADSLLRSTRKGNIRYFFNQLVKYRTRRREWRRKYQVAQILESNTDANVLLRYYCKLEAYKQWKVRHSQIQKVMHILARSVAFGLLGTYYYKLQKYTKWKKLAIQNNQLVVQLSNRTTTTLARRYFSKLRDHCYKKQKRAWQIEATNNLLRRTTQQMLSEKFRLWYMRHVLIRRQQQKEIIAEHLAVRTASKLLVRYYGKLRRYALGTSCAALLVELRDENSNYHKCKRESQQLEKHVQQWREFSQVRNTVQKLQNETEQLAVRNAQLAEIHDSLEARIQAKHEEPEADVEWLRSQVVETMSMLKAEALNLDVDFKMISEIRDKCKVIPVTRVFLEAHAKVKRAVVGVTGNNQTFGMKWTLTRELLHKIPQHQLTTILTSIKQMIIAYDMMDIPTRDSLQTDEEIVANALWLIEMVSIALSYRRRKLGTH